MHKTTQVLETLALAAVLLFGSVGLAAAGKGHDHDKTKKAGQEDSDRIYTVGGDVMKPTRLDGPVPGYPESARKEKIQGVVIARLLIEKDGSVSSTRVVQSLRDDFDALTLEAVRQWTFEPATLEGDAVRVEYNITVNYKLDDDADKSGDP